MAREAEGDPHGVPLPQPVYAEPPVSAAPIPVICTLVPGCTRCITARRAWIGINKPGGIGTITKVWEDEQEGHYDVKYSIGGREKMIEARFLSHFSFTVRTEDRRETMGRCRYCRCMLKFVVLSK